MPLGLKLFLLVAAVLLTGATLVLWRAGAREARAEAAYPPEGQFINLPQGRIHALVMGQDQGNAPDLVLIHGASGNIRDMTFRLAPALAERYRVFIFDRPGLGYSDPLNVQGASLAQQAQALQQAAAALGADQPIVVGQSYGGAVALAWAVHQPDTLSALVPLAAASNPWETPLDPLYRVTSSTLGSAIVVPMLTAFVSPARVERAIAAIFAPHAAPLGYDEHVGAALSLRRGTLRANALQRRNILAEIKALQPRYGTISVPTEILHGTADDTVPLRVHSAKLVDQIPDAMLTELPGVGHMPHQTATREVVDAIDRAAARAGLR